MTRIMTIKFNFAALAAALFSVSAAAALPPQNMDALVNETIEPLMKQQAIPGMAVAVIYQGKPSFYYYGLADVKARRPVTEETLFELGSVSKTFTGTAGGYAIQSGIARLSDPASRYSAQLTGSQWQNITLLQLATYSAGGLPLQVPENITREADLWRYYNAWQPTWTPGTQRLYSNASIGLFGALVVKNSGVCFERYMQQHVFAPLKLNHTWIVVPEREKQHYAWGYRQGQPVRVNPGMLDAQAYGIKTTIRDMATFMQANIAPEQLVRRDPQIARAIDIAQQGYGKSGERYQGLGWEIYPWPVDPQRVITASGSDIALRASPIALQTPPRPMTPASWVHKTGSTNGFGAYIAFIPQQQLGIVMLANKNFPNPVRVTAAWRILQKLQ